MSDLQDEMVELLHEHKNGLSVEEVHSQVQQRSKLNVPQGKKPIKLVPAKPL